MHKSDEFIFKCSRYFSLFAFIYSDKIHLVLKRELRNIRSPSIGPYRQIEKDIMSERLLAVAERVESIAAVLPGRTVRFTESYLVEQFPVQVYPYVLRIPVHPPHMEFFCPPVVLFREIRQRSLGLVPLHHAVRSQKVAADSRRRARSLLRQVFRPDNG